MTPTTEVQNLIRQVEQATYLGFHKGNYGLRHYASTEQKELVLQALRAYEQSSGRWTRNFTPPTDEQQS